MIAENIKILFQMRNGLIWFSTNLLQFNIYFFVLSKILISLIQMLTVRFIINFKFYISTLKSKLDLTSDQDYNHRDLKFNIKI